MKIDVNLSKTGISQAIRNIEWYKSYLQWKLERFTSELANVGIEIIQQNVKVEVDGVVTDFGSMITFQKDISVSEEITACTLITTGQPYIKEWETGEALVNPLLMAEFGSGVYAIGGAQGTFPNQKYANRPPWFWKDLQGITHMSYGNEPTRPLLKAVQEMEKQIHDIAQRVFSE